MSTIQQFCSLHTCKDTQSNFFDFQNWVVIYYRKDAFKQAKMYLLLDCALNKLYTNIHEFDFFSYSLHTCESTQSNFFDFQILIELSFIIGKMLLNKGLYLSLDCALNKLYSSFSFIWALPYIPVSVHSQTSLIFITSLTLSFIIGKMLLNKCNLYMLLDCALNKLYSIAYVTIIVFLAYLQEYTVKLLWF